jgi:hypothetical protein
VLILRAGVGAGPPRSRARVARRLDLRVRRVMRVERSGLRKVRALARGGSCGGGANGSGAATAGGAAGGDSDGGVTSLASTGGVSASAGAGGVEDGSGSTSGSGSRDGESGGVRGESDSRSGLFGNGGLAGPSAVPGGTPMLVAIALILLAALAGYAAPQVGRRMGSS